MFRGRILVAALVFAICALIVTVGLSLRKAVESLSELASFERPTIASETERVFSAANSPAGSQLAAANNAPEFQITAASEIEDRAVDSFDIPLPEPINFSIEHVVVKVDYSEPQRCGYFFEVGEIRNGIELNPAFAPSLSDSQFAAVADSLDDSFIYYQYARHLDNRVDSVEHPLFPTMEDYYIRAARGHNVAGVELLAARYYSVDRVRSRAWWRISEEMGGDGLQSSWSRALYIYTDQENSDGMDFAETLMNEYRLGPGLGRPEECLSTDEIIAQRRHLAELFRRLAMRAAPVEAPDEPPVVFNRLNGRDLVVEDVCAVNCPLDTQRVIYFANDPDDGRNCAQANGAEQTILARSPAAGLQERTFCVPVLFTGD